jgi:hypothetical protein
MSRIGARVDEKCILPGKGLQAYVDVKDEDLRKKYPVSGKMPMQVFHDAYFDGKIDFKGESLWRCLSC